MRARRVAGSCRGPDPARRAPRRAPRDDRAPHAAPAAALADRGLVLRRPLRARRHRELGRHGRPAPPAHGARDGQLAVHRRGRAPRQPRHPRDGPPRRAQPHDRWARGRALRGQHAGHHPAARRAALGRAARPCPRPAPRLRPPRPRDDGSRRRRRGPCLPRDAGRVDVAGGHRDPAARRGAAPRAGCPVDARRRPHLRARPARRPWSRHAPGAPGGARRARRRRPRPVDAGDRRGRRARPPRPARRPALRRADRHVVELRGRTHDEIVAFRADWEAGSERFGQVEGYVGRDGRRGADARLPAPALPHATIRPRGNPG